MRLVKPEHHLVLSVIVFNEQIHLTGVDVYAFPSSRRVDSNNRMNSFYRFSAYSDTRRSSPFGLSNGAMKGS